MKRTIICAVLVLAANVSPAWAGARIAVPTDARANYQVVSMKRVDARRVEIVTQRDGPSGRSFSKRQVDCRAMTFRYLGDGDTMREMLASQPEPRMSALVTGSISYYVSKYACAHVR